MLTALPPTRMGATRVATPFVGSMWYSEEGEHEPVAAQRNVPACVVVDGSRFGLAAVHAEAGGGAALPVRARMLNSVASTANASAARRG